jgi:hypothetical protein
MMTLARSEEEWSDLPDERDVFASDDDLVQSPPAAAPSAASTDDDLGNEDSDDLSI